MERRYWKSKSLGKDNYNLKEARDNWEQMNVPAYLFLNMF